MEFPTLVRRGGLAALVAGVVGVLFAPLYALAYFQTQDGGESLSEFGPLVPWHETLGPALEPLLTFASPDTVYLTYGKLWLVVTLGWLAGTLALHSWQSSRAGRAERWGFRIVVVALTLLTAGVIGAYFVVHLAPTALDASFSWLMVPAFVLMAVGWPLFGAGTLRAGVAPKVGGWLLTLGWFPGFVLLTFVLGQLTAATLLLQVAWIVLGHAMWSQARSRTPDPVRPVEPAPAA
ncbi:hypothetical protein [Blastococcus sp. CT_GayMR16]|uniref:hypothetical protein n=1 Tax=Blastococcus sp. CT_GayMR16 TaxID=2559607 RepID=UPI00107430B1|nr:hypothetical protein [Blastococcus sp. CT_GayMR16]TFV90032.1 hypothetical protein E4P38_06255 [Blastococcus sp. CT_GayMR16]